jgi:REP element-mobilizing transposase RayT
MPQSLSRVWLHIIFSTKDRQTFLRDDGLREEMFKMLAHQANETGCPSAKVGGWIDHVHVLCGLSRTVTIAGLVEVLKRETSKWAKQRSPKWGGFYWQSGYGAFSVSQSNLASVIEYIEQQAEHHARLTFQDEFRALCAKHEIEIDERYVWD